MSNNKHCQIIELENEELRIRLKDLQKQLDAAEAKLVQYQTPSAVKPETHFFHLESLAPNEFGNRYQIVDERGYVKESFYCSNDEVAKSFFHKYREEYTPCEYNPIYSHIRGGVYSSLIEIKFKYISIMSEELELKPSISYVFYVGKEAVYHFPANTTREQAISQYNHLLETYLHGCEKMEHNNTILI